MKPNKTSTILNWADEILIPFVNEDGYIEFDDEVDPEFVMYMDSVKSISNMFLITLKNDVCPCCNCKLTLDGTVDFILNTLLLLKNRNISAIIKIANIVKEVYGKSILNLVAIIQ